MELGYQDWGTCEVSTFYSRKTKGATENGSRIRHPAFLFVPRFVSPAIIIHTPNARIAADSAASRKSHCFFIESFLFQMAFVFSAMTMRAPAQMRRPLLS